MIDLLAAKRRCTPMGGALFIGGSSSSKSSQTTIDGRITAGNESVAVSVSGGNNNTINATTTDFGAVSKSLDLAMKGVDNITGIASQSLDESAKLAGASLTFAQRASSDAGSILSGALNSMTGQQKEFANALENIKAGDARPLVYVGLGVVALVAVVLIIQTKKG